MSFIGLSIKSLLNRKFTVLLTIGSMALSVVLLLGVERIRNEVQNSFTNTISGTDLIVGARSGPEQLLLYSIFRIGDATNNMDWHSYEEIAADPRIKWTIPISLGDSHQGFRVMGTTDAYFNHYHYADRRNIELNKGALFTDLFDCVLGADVAEVLNCPVGSEVIINHGSGEISFHKHEDKPFRVTGILKRTGTPIDQTIHVGLNAIEALHIDWQDGMPAHNHEMAFSADEVRLLNLEPEKITAFLVGLHSRADAFHVQRFVNEFKEEPLTAIVPAMALQQLWGLLSKVENALVVVSAFVVIVGLIGMLVSLLTSLNERRREMAILRSVGASPLHIFTLITGEALFMTITGIISGITALYCLLLLAIPYLEGRFGIYLSLSGLSAQEIVIIGIVILASFIIGIIPGYRIYRYSLTDGININT
jgi:putative ABC transport system permease protein